MAADGFCLYNSRRKSSSVAGAKSKSSGTTLNMLSSCPQHCAPLLLQHFDDGVTRLHCSFPVLGKSRTGVRVRIQGMKASSIFDILDSTVKPKKVHLQLIQQEKKSILLRRKTSCVMASSIRECPNGVNAMYFDSHAAEEFK